MSVLSACGGSSSGSHGAITKIEVTPDATSIPLGKTEQYTATAIYEDNAHADVTRLVAWTSSDASVLTIDSEGLATPVATGTATVTATLDDISGSTTATVTAAIAVSMQLTPSSDSIPKGYTQAFVASATFTDGTTRDVSADASWSSGDTDVITVSNASGTKGQATGVAEGSAQVVATYENITARAAVTVTAAELASVDISPSSATLPVGASQQYTATGVYTDHTTEDLTTAVTWASSDSSVAEISNSTNAQGFALADAAGPTTITATYGDLVGSTTLTVTGATVESISVTPVNSKLAAGYSRQFTATGIYSDGSSHDVTQTVTWSSSDESVATVSNAGGSNGMVAAKVAGSTTISAVSGSVSGSAALTVTNATLTSVGVTPANKSIAVGTTQQYTATAVFSDGTTIDYTSLAGWASSDANVATISNDSGAVGLAKANNTGSTVITATVTKTDSSGAVSGTTPLTVTAAAISSISVTPQDGSVPLGSTLQYHATATYTDGSTGDVTNDVTWTSSDTDVATVTTGSSARGLVTGEGKGTATLKATDAATGVVGSAPVTVTDAVLSSIAISPADTSVAKGGTVDYTATGTYTDGSTMDISDDVTWTTDDETIATISNADGEHGVATAQGEGDTTVVATLGDVSGETTLTVTAATLVSIAVSPDTVSIASGTTTQLKATGTFSDGSTADETTAVTWASSDESVATVSNASGNQGLVTSVAVGSTTITASMSGVDDATAAVTVTESALTNVTIAPTAATSIPVGYFVEYTATGHYADGSTQDLTADVSWRTLDDSVATVNAKGYVTAKAAGSTTVVATYSGFTKSASVQGVALTLSSIAVTPANSTIAAGTTLQFTATGSFSDGSTTLDLTHQVTWSSSNSNAATIDANGLASAGSFAFTSTTIKAVGKTDTGVSGSTTLRRTIN
ncbi:beta strand repeat-containing protein [Solimonas marina]|uniref:ATP-dependent DNA ligase n=1 Tax=Solimonas marina TaxID=2714601 RepID=A0A970B6I4_9GAMM|nr:Ig-like domain-containing protein [Solimonas marina]NKF22838.1 ATP-dependent DNA ligase [Solimonas marina]